MLTRGGQWIAIKKPIPFQAKPIQCRIVQAPFQYINVLRIAFQRIHSLIPKNHPHRCTGLAVGIFIGKIIIHRKTFIASRRSYPSSHVHITVHHILPNRLHCIHVAHIVFCCSHIGSARVEIHRAYRMARNFLLFFYWHIILSVFRSPMWIVPDSTFAVAMSALIQKPVG